MVRDNQTEPFDALIIGGGPAGLSAAVYLGRARRSVAVIDCPWPGRSDWAQTNHNYLGFPDGISIVEFCQRGRQQAERFGACFIEAQIDRITNLDGLFEARAEGLTLQGRTAVLATGVADRWATFPGYEEYIGRSLHWCTVCDGYEMKDQRVLVIGNDEAAAEMATQLLRHTPRVTILTNHDSCDILDETIENLATCGIQTVTGRLASARARERGFFEAVALEDGGEIAVDHVFSAQGARPNTALVEGLGLRCNAEGYIEVDTEAKTNIEGLYAAGDVNRLL